MEYSQGQTCLSKKSSEQQVTEQEPATARAKSHQYVVEFMQVICQTSNWMSYIYRVVMAQVDGIYRALLVIRSKKS